MDNKVVFSSAKNFYWMIILWSVCFLIIGFVIGSVRTASTFNCDLLSGSELPKQEIEVEKPWWP